MQNDDESRADPPHVGLDRLRMNDALQQVEPSRVDYAPHPEDGLPSPVIRQQEPFVPPLALETLICLPDESIFVIRDKYGTVLKIYGPDEVDRTPNGRWLSKPTQDGNCFEVTPIRPKCIHLSRQLMDCDGDPTRMMMERCCTARRDSGGEFLSVANMQIIACELRDPPDIVSEERLRKWDARKIKLGAERRANGEGFDLASLDHDPDEDLEGVIE